MLHRFVEEETVGLTRFPLYTMAQHVRPYRCSVNRGRDAAVVWFDLSEKGAAL